MKWSLQVGRFWGAEIHLHASLLLLIPYALLVFKPEDLPGALRVLLLISAIFVCVALHEMGHTLAARLLGIQVTSIVLWPLGGFANLSRRPEKVLPDLAISAAGPLANLLIFAGLAVVTGLEQVVERSNAFPALSRLLYQLDLFPFLAGICVANLSLAVFNLVPVYPLDGGQIARGVLKLLFGEKRADQIMLFISLPLALALVVIGVISTDIVVVLTGGILLLAALTLNLRLTNLLTLGVLYFLDRAGYYYRRLDFDPALREYTRAIQRSPNRPGLYISRAVVQMSLLDLEAAWADIERALALDNSNPLAWTLRGELLSLGKEKDDPGAMACYDKAIALRPGWSVGYLDRGSRYHDRGDFPRALEQMNKGVDLGKGSPIGYLLRSQLRFEMGDLPGSHADADQALRFAPHWMLVFSEIFLTNLEGHLNWALDYYWRAIERMPNAYQVYQGRADACRANHRPDWAVEDYHRAIRLAPNLGELYLARGICYSQLGLTDQAAEDLRQAVRLSKKSHIRRQAQALLNQIAPSASQSPATEQNAPAA